MRLIPTAVFLALSVLAQLPVLGQQAAPEAAANGFVALFSARNATTLAVLQAEFPADHVALLTRVAAIAASGQNQEAMLSAGFAAIGTIRRKYAERLRFAPAQTLSDLLVHTAEFHDAVYEGEGVGGCGYFARNGTGTLYELGVSERYAALIDLQTALYLRAAVAGIEQPEIYGATGERDFAALLSGMAAAGLPKAFVEAIASANPANENLCPALSTMFRAAAVYNTPEGLRVRADLAQNLAGY